MPISGMTGFGRAEGALGAWTWAVEARSVNGRNLETRFRGPPGFDGLERITREGAQARFQRGNITVGVQAKRTEGAGSVRINHDQIARYLAAGAVYVADGRAVPPRLDGLLALRGVIEADDTGLDPEAVAAEPPPADPGAPEPPPEPSAEQLATAPDERTVSPAEVAAANAPATLAVAMRVAGPAAAGVSSTVSLSAAIGIGMAARAESHSKQAESGCAAKG